MEDEYALHSLFTHLYGDLAATVARLADCKPSDNVAVLAADQTQLQFVSQQSAAPLEGEEPADPLPSVEFVPPDLTELHDAEVVVGLLPSGQGPMLKQTADLISGLAAWSSLSRAVLLLPASLLSHPRAELREALLAAGSIEEIVFGEPRWARRIASIQWAITRIAPGGRETKTKISGLDGEYSEGFERKLEADTPWTLTGLDPDLESRINRWAKKTNAQPLKQLVKHDRERESDDTSPPLLARAVKRGGFDLQEVEDVGKSKNRPLQVLRAGDVVGRTLGDDPMWCVVPEEADGRRVVAGQLHVLAPVGITPELLVTFLSSEMARLQLGRAARGVVPRVSTKALHELRVPDLAGLHGLDPTGGLQELRVSSTELLEDLTDQVEGSFDLGQADLKHALAEAERDARLAAAMIRQVRDDGYRAQQTFPHPLARAIRQLRMRRDAQDPRGSYDELMRVGETTTIFLGVVLGSLMQEDGFECQEVDDWRTAASQGGVSLGHWQGLIRRGAEAARRASQPLGGLASALRTNGPLESALEHLLKQRNDDAHGSGPRTLYEYESRLDELGSLLADVLEGLSALAHCQFFIVDKMEYASTSGFRLEGRDLRGDHPDFMPWSRETGHPLDTGVVHIDFGDGSRVLPLYNYCRLIACSQCLREELYYPDRIKGDEIQMRSLERGHRTSAVDSIAAGLLLGQ